MFPYEPRAVWGAHAPTGALTRWPAGQPTGHTLHWEGAGGHVDHANCAAEVRSIQAYHQHTGYVDIAYNWIICVHGVIFEGRPVASYESAAQRAGNPLHIAICFMWGPSFHLSEQARDAAIAIYVRGPRHVIGHRNEPSCTTSCPGDEIEAFVGVLANSVTVTLPAQPGPSPVPLPLPPAGVHHPTLALGAVGPAVMELQRKLNGGAGQHLVVDGHFGPATMASVKNVQSFFHVAVDGIAGPTTWGLVDYAAALKGIR